MAGNSKRILLYEQIIYEVADNIATITLNRPQHLNAFTGIMMTDMIEAFDQVRPRTTRFARSS